MSRARDHFHNAAALFFLGNNGTGSEVCGALGRSEKIEERASSDKLDRGNRRGAFLLLVIPQPLSLLRIICEIYKVYSKQTFDTFCHDSMPRRTKSTRSSTRWTRTWRIKHTWEDFGRHCRFIILQILLRYSILMRTN